MGDGGALSILHGRLVDPANGIDAQCDLHIAGGRVVAIGTAPPGFEPTRTIDARGQVVCPGFVDLCARMREPGSEQKATIASETRAAAASGITALCCPPDTQPPIDTPAVAQLVRQTAQRHGNARIFPAGALTQGLAGTQISEMAALKAAGCPVMSHADRPITDRLVLRRALEYAATFDLTVFLRPEDPFLSAGGCMHEGRVSTRLGLPGIPEAAETVAVASALALAEQAQARIHFRGLSTARATEMVHEAQRRGLAASADVSAIQLILTEEDVGAFDSHCHLLPPLRTERDRAALRAAVASGVITAICSDHQPHDADAKLAPFPATAPGSSALETLLPLALQLVDEGIADLPTMIARLTCGPAEILGKPLLGRLDEGHSADICIFDAQALWTLDPDKMVSLGRNTPFAGRVLKGRVSWTLLAGRVVYQSPQK